MSDLAWGHSLLVLDHVADVAWGHVALGQGPRLTSPGALFNVARGHVGLTWPGATSDVA